MSKKERKANAQSIKYCKRIDKGFEGSTYGDCLDVLMTGFVYDISTDCESRSDQTTIYLYKDPGEKADLIEKFVIPNKEVYDWKRTDWNWEYIYKLLVDWMIKNRKKYATKPKKERTKKKA